jgi:DNA-binding XRE family transcriptional regulator
MIDTAKLKGKIVERGYTQQDVAYIIGKTPKTFYAKMKKGVFDSNEISAMVEALAIENPTEIFFANKVAQ